jgi:Ca-activated chloride channel family protein
MLTPARSIFLAASILVTTACGGPPKLAVKNDVIVQAAPATSLITMTAEPSQGLVVADAAGKLAVRIRISAPPLADADRPPLNLALVLDTSASMEGAAIASLKDAAHKIVGEMSSKDRLTVVAFHSRAEVLLESTTLDARGIAAATTAIDKIQATGTTDLGAGLGLGLQQLLAHRAAGGIDRMVLLADGFPNDPMTVPPMVQSAAASGIAITTIGIGIEHSQEMLDEIAKNTGGVYRYAPDGTEIASVFEKELLRIQTLVARNMTLQIGPGPGVVIGSAQWITMAGRGGVVSLGDLAAGEVRDVIVPLDVPGHTAGLTVELLDADLSFTDAIAGSPQSRSAFVSVKASDDASAITTSIKMDLIKGQARAEAAGAIIQAINLARGGAIDDAKKLLAAAEQAARKAATKLADTELGELADRMTELGRNLARLVVQAQIAQPVTDSQHLDGMTMVPAQAPPSVEPAIRDTLQKATSTLDGR